MPMRRNDESAVTSHWTRTVTVPARTGMSFRAAAMAVTRIATANGWGGAERTEEPGAHAPINSQDSIA